MKTTSFDDPFLEETYFFLKPISYQRNIRGQNPWLSKVIFQMISEKYVELANIELEIIIFDWTLKKRPTIRHLPFVFLKVFIRNTLHIVHWIQSDKHKYWFRKEHLRSLIHNQKYENATINSFEEFQKSFCTKLGGFSFPGSEDAFCYGLKCIQI